MQMDGRVNEVVNGLLTAAPRSTAKLTARAAASAPTATATLVGVGDGPEPPRSAADLPALAVVPGGSTNVFARALDWLGPDRLLFGTDSSFFPRGWQRGVSDIQHAILEDLGIGQAARDQVFGGNFARLLGSGPRPPEGAHP